MGSPMARLGEEARWAENCTGGVGGVKPVLGQKVAEGGNGMRLVGKVRAKANRPSHARQEAGTCLWEAVGQGPGAGWTD